MKKNYIAPVLSVMEVETQAILAASGEPQNFDSKFSDGTNDTDGYAGEDATSKGMEFWED